MGIVIHFVIGLLFGVGLWLSGMTDQRKIFGFLDVTRAWDPTLLWVMGGALAVAFIGFRLVLRRAKPLREPRFDLPTSTAIDARLIGGAALFGIGWGLGGYCPGPALAALALGSLPTLTFVAAMVAGILVARYLAPWRGASRSV